MSATQLIIFTVLLIITAVFVYVMGNRYINKKYKAMVNDNFINGFIVENKDDVKKIEDKANPSKLELTDEELIELIQKRMVFRESFEDLDHNESRLQIVNDCIHRFISYGHSKVYKLDKIQKKKVINTLQVYFDGTDALEFTSDELKFPYGDFYKWFYTSDKPFFHFKHDSGFSTILRSTIKRIEYRKENVQNK